MKVLSIYKSGSGCDYHRIKLPFDYEPGIIDNEVYEKLPKNDILAHMAASELVVWNRICAVKPTIMEKHKAENSFKTVVDIDDHWDLYYGHILYSKYRSAKIPEILKYNIRSADAVTVTTERLAEEVARLHKNVCMIPNCLPNKGQFERKTEPVRPAFVYVAGSSHGTDILELRQVMKRIAGEKWITDNADFQLSGWVPGPVWQKMEGVFSAHGKIKTYIRKPGLDLDNYMDHYEAATCALIPLERNRFNSFKSPLKILEAGAKKIPCICSFVPPYSDIPDAPVLWVKKYADWYRHIKWVLRYPEKAQEMGDHLYRWIHEKYNFDKWNKKRFDFYQSVI